MAKRGKRHFIMRDLPLLVVMAKAPVCGAVKSRLASDIGRVQACALYRTLTATLLRELARDPRFETVLAVAPDWALRAPFAAWNSRPPHPNPSPKGRGETKMPLRLRREKDRSEAKESLLRRRRVHFKSPSPLGERAGVRGDSMNIPKPLRVAQGKGGIGQRMQRIFDRNGRGPLIIVGTDIPFVTASVIADAFRRLASADAVFGPAEDGGYWLVGLRCRPRRLAPFANVRWSTKHSLGDTLENLTGHRVAFAKTLFDIDTVTDYRRYSRARMG
jgi:glycosyltransferase A (GT-A) superfamily protein (DUF2064 family)